MTSGVAAGAIDSVRAVAARTRNKLFHEVGGPARFKVIAILAAVVALDGADKGTVSAAADNLKHAFGINNTDVGLLLTASALVGAAFTIPVGALTDRVRRTRLLALSILLWAAAMFFGGAAQSFTWLIVSRVALGAVTATAGPTVASLTGDYFPARERARMYGFILAGELVGTGLGFAVSGYLSAHLSWRYTFWWLTIPSAVLVVLVWRLAEPARGGQSRLDVGQEAIPDARDVADQPAHRQQEQEQAALHRSRDGVARQVVERRKIQPYSNQVLDEDPAGWNLWRAVKYILRVRTDVVIIVASALGYFYFSGFRTFVVVFAQDHYGISKSLTTSLTLVVGIGALVGVYAGGRASDRLMDRGVVNARVLVPAAVMLSVPLVLAPAVYVTALWVAVPLLTLGAGLLGAANPPQDAGRLDIIHPHLWGRSEGVRSALRGLLDAAAPLTFGWVSDNLFGGNVSVGANKAAHGSGTSLEYTFLLFLFIPIAAGLIVLLGMRTYPRDVATADASVRRTLGVDKERRDKERRDKEQREVPYQAPDPSRPSTTYAD